MAVCGYALGASNPSGGININGNRNPMTQSEFFEIVRVGSPLLAAVLAGGVAWKFGSIQAGIAQQQAATAATAAATAKKKLKLDLFDRRWVIYKVVTDALTHAWREQDFTPECERAYKAGIQGARWLFDKELDDYLQKALPSHLDTLRKTALDLSRGGNHDQKVELNNKLVKAHMAIGQQQDKVEQYFGKYLEIES